MCKITVYGQLGRTSLKIGRVIKVILYSYLILKKMNERITDS